MIERKQGYNAFFNNLNEESNPYQSGTQQYFDWSEGWLQAQGEWLEASMDIGMY